ncbi:hypothetical protein FB45DRAFT_914563, partial [Roridomyces roridus]
LSAARARIAQLHTEIDKLQRLMDSLLAERDQCCQTLADFKYPILTLPTEILSEIFLQFLPPYPERPSFIGKKSPSFLLQICRRWRDVALATPALWSTMNLLLYNSNHHAQQRDLLKIWLQRSGNCALSIRVDYLKEANDDGTIIEECLAALLRHASRWQDIDVTLPFEELRGISGAMPFLRSVTIGIESWEERPEEPVVLFADAPALKHVVLSRSFDPFMVSLPWSQITTLNADEFYTNEIVEILRQTTMLEDCTLTILSGAVSLPASSIHIPSLPLRSLRLKWDDYPNPGQGAHEAQQLFRALHLPALETLMVHEIFLGPHPIATLPAVFPNGFPQQIEIFGAYTPREDYKAAFPRASLTVYGYGRIASENS